MKAESPDRRPWDPGATRPRVLIEHADLAESWADARILRRAGFEVRSCPGPEERLDHRCPLAEGEHCDLVDGADVIWNALALHTREREVVEAEIALYGNTPIVLEAPEPKATRDVVTRAANVDLVARPVTPRRLVEGVRRAMRRRPPPPRPR